MKMRSLVVSLLVAVPVPPAVAQEGAHPPHWGYAGEVGPEHWSEFESDFGTCSSGRNQSPIDLANFIQAELAPIRFDYRPGGGYQVVNNGHAVQVDHRTGSSITVDDTVFELKQFHFHSPSENTIAGRSYPMEAHFVHVDDKGNLAVVALMFEEGAGNPLLDRVWPQVPLAVDGRAPLEPGASADDLLPADRDYYRYEGSLTTPPCSEGVRWLVLKQPARASGEQLRKVGEAIGQPNNRPLQPVGARVVLE
ncbi:carbonic anhydrase family protein [Luteimonas viscosa]|uniref:Carbonic anhydrase n=1 Tax=Luteimonas viscosa TaxID=1132694 RepID=A0A5D4XPP9_9GAMM|nr:carbonic anhydrase family protein [Luteimonas viscosa]TYT25935.1 carbonic anhydrase family protein [Luteimonas viscosa]